VGAENVVIANGSDELLAFAFLAFCDETRPAAFPDITYGFYPVYANLYGIPYTQIPLAENLAIDPADYMGINKNIVIANPNAPTGIALAHSDIETVLAANKDRLFIADEAYAAFSEDKSCVPLLKKYENLLVVQTYSKSYSLAGMRLGYALGAPALIDVLRRVKNSFNPYNLDRLSIEVGAAAILDKRHLSKTVRKTIETREYTREKLERLGFHVLPSEANYLFLRRDGIEGIQLYQKLRGAGILVRHFNSPRICDFIRLSIGMPKDMKKVIEVLGEI
jgi:histidinol-phosphate aminotransferase